MLPDDMPEMFSKIFGQHPVRLPMPGTVLTGTVVPFSFILTPARIAEVLANDHLFGSFKKISRELIIGRGSGSGTETGPRLQVAGH